MNLRSKILFLATTTEVFSLFEVQKDQFWEFFTYPKLHTGKIW